MPFNEKREFQLESWHGTTILGVRKVGRTVIAGDGQVSLGNTVIKPNAKKVRRLGAEGKVIAGFAGATADAFTLFERLEKKLEASNGKLMRAAVELAKDWRTDKYLRNLEAMMIVADGDQEGDRADGVQREGPTTGRARIGRHARHGGDDRDQRHDRQILEQQDRKSALAERRVDPAR